MSIDIVINGKTIPMEVGMEATINYGSDSHPAKVTAFKETGTYLYITLEEFQYRATAKGKAEGTGHQDWEILWDKPLQGRIEAKVRKSNGKFVGDKGFSSISLGSARCNYCWEF